MKQSAAAGKLSGKKLVVTGFLQGMSREDAAERIRNAGGTFQSAVGKDTDYLVVGGNVGASKIDKATKLGVKIINQEQFLELV